MDFDRNQHNKTQRYPSSHPNDFTRSLNNSSWDGATIDSYSYFDEYDHAMESAQLKADLQDYCYGFYNQQQQQQQQEQERQRNKNTTMLLIEQEDYQRQHRYSQHTNSQLERVEDNYYFPDYYDKEGVIRAEVPPEEEQDGKQSASSMESYNNDALLYLILDVQSYISEMSNAGLMTEQDSPLFELQYKMYTYMKHCASEAGFDIDSLSPPP